MARQKEREPEDYRKDAERDAARMALHFLDEIVAHILENGKAPDQLYRDYEGGDEYHHSRHVDRSYSLHEAADVIEQLEQVAGYEAEELSVGLGAREIVSILAAGTYGNAVYEFWQKLIGKINYRVDEQDFKGGPKEWSPHGTAGKLKDLIKDLITVEIEG